MDIYRTMSGYGMSDKTEKHTMNFVKPHATSWTLVPASDATFMTNIETQAKQTLGTRKKKSFQKIFIQFSCTLRMTTL